MQNEVEKNIRCVLLDNMTPIRFKGRFYKTVQYIYMCVCPVQGMWRDDWKEVLWKRMCIEKKKVNSKVQIPKNI